MGNARNNSISEAESRTDMNIFLRAVKDIDHNDIAVGKEYMKC